MKREISEINYANPPQKVFKTIEQFREVRSVIIEAMNKVKAKKNQKSGSFLINRLVVNFTKAVKAEEIFIDYLNGQIVLEAPVIKGESQQEMSQRRMSYYSSLIKSVEAISTIAITHIYLVLNDSGRKALEGKRARKS